MSDLSFVPTTDDDGKAITCRAENPNITGAYLEASWKIEVVCKFRDLFYIIIFYSVLYIL